MKLPRLTLARIVRALGTLLLSASALGFLSWMQRRDPECLLGEVGKGALLQLRVCEPYIDSAQGAPWWQLAAVVALALVGWLCARFTRRRLAAAWRAFSAYGPRWRRVSCRLARAAAARR